MDIDGGTQPKSPPPYQAQSPDDTFSEILTSTLKNIKEIVTDSGHFHNEIENRQ